jgi:hypothetical protein
LNRLSQYQYQSVRYLVQFLAFLLGISIAMYLSPPEISVFGITSWYVLIVPAWLSACFLQGLLPEFITYFAVARASSLALSFLLAVLRTFWYSIVLFPITLLIVFGMQAVTGYKIFLILCLPSVALVTATLSDRLLFLASGEDNHGVWRVKKLARKYGVALNPDTFAYVRLLTTDPSNIAQAARFDQYLEEFEALLKQMRKHMDL